MIYIFHGDNESDSRNAYNDQISQFNGSEIIRLDSKTIDLDQINNFLNGQTLFQTTKVIAISNLFSITKSILDKLCDLINKCAPENNIIIWQDKLLNATQLKVFPKAQVKFFKANNIVFSCLNEIRPNNLKNFIPKLQQVINENMYDLFLYLAKNSIRKQLNSYTKFTPQILKKAYINLIELDYQNKSGTLSTPKQIAIERIFIGLLK